MAELFSYTPSGGMATPASPDIQVRPNNQAAETFKSLQNLLSTGMEAKTQQIKEKSAILGEAMQLRRMELANIEATKKMEADAAKAAKDEEELRQHLMAKEQIAGADAIFQANLAGLAADDVDGRRQLTADYVASVDEVFNAVDPKVQKGIFDFANSKKTGAQKQWVEFAQKYNIDTYMDQMAFASDSFIAAEKEQQAAMFQSWQAGANRRGIDNKQFGEDFTKIIGSNIAVRLDQGNIVENRDFESIRIAQSTLKNLREIDPRAVKEIETAQNKLDAINTQLVNAVKGDVDDARQANDRDRFSQVLQYGVQNGVYTPEQADVEFKKFVKTNYNQSKMDEYAAKMNLGYTGGNLQIDTLPEGQRKYAKSMVTDMLRNMLRQGTLEPSKLEYHARYNPDVFRSEFKAAFGQLTAVAMTTAQDAMGEKDPERKAQLWNQYLQQTQRMDALASVSNYSMETDELVNASIVKAVAMSGQQVSIAEIRKNMEQRGGDILIPSENSNVRAIYDADGNIPQDMRPEAHRVFSALVQSGMEQPVALEAVTNSFSFSEVDGTNLRISGNVQQLLNQAGVGADSMKFLVDVMLNDGSLKGLADETFSEDVRSNLQAVFSGTEPTAHMYKGHLYFENAEGTTALIRMTRDDAVALTEAMNTAYRASEGEPIGIPKMADDFVKAIAPAWSREIQGVTDIADVVANASEVVADSVIPSWGAISTLFEGQVSNINLFIDELYKGATLEEAQANTIAREEKLIKAYQAEIKKATGESSAALEESWNQVKADWEATKGNLEGGVDYLKDFFPSAVRALKSVLINEAEAAIPKAGTEYFKQSGVTTSVEVAPMAFKQDSFLRYIGERAEGRHGYNAKAGTYTPALTADAKEAGKANKSSDIGYGHKIKDYEWESGMIHGHQFYDPKTKKNIPLTETQVQDIMQKDMAENLTGVLPNWNSKIADMHDGRDFNDFSPAAQAVLSSLAYNVGSSSAKSWKEIFNNDGLFYPIMVPDEIAKFANDLRRTDAGKNTAGMDNRVMKELVAAGLIYDEYTFDMVTASLPLMNEYSDFESTLK